MKLYWIESESRYVHRLSDIPKGETPDQREIPTDLQSLMEHLNKLHATIKELQNTPSEAFEGIKAGLEDALAFAQGDTSRGVVATPTRIEQTMTQISVEEAIQNADPAQLAKYAENVCWRIKELANGTS